MAQGGITESEHVTGGVVAGGGGEPQGELTIVRASGQSSRIRLPGRDRR